MSVVSNLLKMYDPQVLFDGVLNELEAKKTTALPKSSQCIGSIEKNFTNGKIK